MQYVSWFFIESHPFALKGHKLNNGVQSLTHSAPLYLRLKG